MFDIYHFRSRYVLVVFIVLVFMNLVDIQPGAQTDLMTVYLKPKHAPFGRNISVTVIMHPVQQSVVSHDHFNAVLFISVINLDCLLMYPAT